jgi:hypothetical protein
MTQLKKPPRLATKKYGAEVVDRDGKLYVAIQAICTLDFAHCYEVADFLYQAGDYMKARKGETDDETSG